MTFKNLCMASAAITAVICLLGFSQNAQAQSRKCPTSLGVKAVISETNGGGKSAQSTTLNFHKSYGTISGGILTCNLQQTGHARIPGKKTGITNANAPDNCGYGNGASVIARVNSQGFTGSSPSKGMGFTTVTGNTCMYSLTSLKMTVKKTVQQSSSSGNGNGYEQPKKCKWKKIWGKWRRICR